MIKGEVDPPSLKVEEFENPFHLLKDSIQTFNQGGDNYGISFKFDSKVDCSVQVFWGVDQTFFNEIEKVILNSFKLENN